MNKEELLRITNIARSALEERRLKEEQDIRLKITNLVEDKEFNELINQNMLNHASKGYTSCKISLNIRSIIDYDKHDIRNFMLKREKRDSNFTLLKNNITLLKSGLENKYKGIIFNFNIRVLTFLVVPEDIIMDINIIWETKNKSFLSIF